MASEILAAPTATPPAPSSRGVDAELAAARARIAELERKVGAKRLIWIFFKRPCGISGKHAGQATDLA